MKWQLLFCAFLCSQVLAGPVGQYQPGQCANVCTSSNKFGYEIGHTYEYEYTLENRIGIKDNNKESKLNLKATVYITPQTSCEFVLQLRDVVVEGDYGNLAADLQRYPLTFAFQDGRIEELCPSAEERQDILNIKRGILSSLQNSMNSLGYDQVVREVDVSGECDAQYSIYSTSWGGGTKTIIKTKDLNACKDRSAHMTGIHSVPYHVDSDYQGLPLIKSTHSCQQIIEDNLIHSVKCDETHTLRPFSSDDSGAVSKLTQTLNFRGKNDVVIVPQEMGEKTDLLFNHLGNTEDKEAMKKTALRILGELTEESQEHVTPELANKFSQFVSTLRKLPFSHLRAVYKSAMNDPRMKKFFMDALPVVGTGAGISLMHEAIKSGEVAESDADMWYTSLAFTNRPTIDMLEASLPLLENYPKQAMLGVSALLHRFCGVNSNCGELPEVKSIVRKFESLLGSACRSTSQQEEDDIIVALKAIGNAGVISNEQVLNKCFEEDTNSMRVRVAALEAFRRLPCSYNIGAEAMRTFRDVNKDTELRIAAYLTVMRCPNHEIITEVKEALSSEPVNQVGSFVWTHLTNLQETSDPAKQEAKELLASDFLRNKFNSDALKQSRNYEMSLFSNKWNIGSQIESNVIFSRSPIPRSINYNFTVNLFGESINLFEIGGRAEGLEAFLEHFFGPNGYFPEEHVEALLQAMKGKPKEDDVDRLGSVEVDPTLDGFLRVFGNELSYGSFKSIDDIKNIFGDFDPFKVIRDLMQQKEIDYTKSSHFMNAQFTVPTSSGLPLSVNVNGTALLRLQAKGGLQSNQQAMEISGHIKPSAAVEIVTLMSVDAGDVTTGIEVLSTLHTSTILDGGFTYNKGKIMNIHFNMPRDRQEIINIDSKVFLVDNNNKRELKKEPQNIMEVQVCSGEMTSRPFGVQMCSDISINSGFPLNGPAHATIYLEKTDDFSQYLLEMKQDIQQDYHTYGIILDTPNSRVNRRNEISMSMDYENGHLDGKLETPFMTFGLTGDYKYTPVKKLIHLVGTSDNEEIFSVHGSLNTAKSTRRGSIYTMKPDLTVTVYNNEIVSLTGSIDSSNSGKSSIDFIVNSMFLREPIELRASENRKEDKYVANAIVKTPVFDGEASIQLAMDRFIISSTYHVAGYDKESFDVSGKYAISSDNTLSGNFGLKISAVPYLNTDGEIISRMSAQDMETKLRVQGLANFELDVKGLYEEQPGLDNIQLQLNYKCLTYQTDYGFKYSQMSSSDATTIKASIKTNTKYDFEFRSQLVHKRSPVNYGADVVFKTQDTNIQFNGKISQASESEFDTNVAVQWNPQYKIKASGKLINTPKTKQATLFVRLPNMDPIQLDGSASLHDKNVAFMAQVQYGKDLYSTSFDLIKDNEEYQIVGRVTTPLTNHSIQATYKYSESEKQVTLDLNCYKHITAKASWSPNSRSMAGFELYWDRYNDDSKKITFTVDAERGSNDRMYAFEGSFLQQSFSAALTKRNNFFDGWIDWGERVSVTVDLTDKFDVMVTTPFEGFEKQRLMIASDIQPKYILAQVDATWKKTEKFGIKLEGRLGLTEVGYTLNSQIEVESTTHPFLDGISVTLDEYSTLTEGRSLFKVVHRGQVYQTSYNVIRRQEGETRYSEGKLEILTPKTTSTGEFLVELNNNNYHYKHMYKVPGLTDHEFEVTAKYDFVSSRKVLDTDIRFSGIYFSPAHFTLNWQEQDSNISFDTTFIYNEKTIIDLKSQASLVSRNTLSGDVSLKYFDNNFTGKFEHNVAVGPTTVLSTRIQGNLNGKEVIANVDGRYTASVTSKEIIVDASLSSPWNAYNDWRIQFQHSNKNKRYQTTLNINKGSQNASFNQDLSIYTLANFEHNLTIKSPYENLKYITMDTEQKWDDNKFAHNTKGSWNDKAILTSVNINRDSTRYGRKIQGDVAVQTPFTNDIKATLKHEYDGSKYNPEMRVDYGGITLINMEAGGYFDRNKGESKIKIMIPKYNPITIRLSYNAYQPQESTLTVEYGDAQKIEAYFKAGIEGRFTVLQWYWEINGLKTDQQIKYSFSRNLVEGEYYIAQPLKPVIQVNAKIEKEDKNQNIEMALKYGSDLYQFLATAILESIGKVEMQFTAPSTHKGIVINYDTSSPEKTLTGYMETESDRYEFNGYKKTNRQEGEVRVNVETPITGLKKLALDISYTNKSNKKTFRIHALKNNDEIKAKGKVTLGMTGEAYLDIFTPFEGYRNFNFKGVYDFTSTEKSIYLNGELDGVSGDASFKGKLTPSESYVEAEMSVPWAEKHSVKLHYKTENKRITITGDWNDERLQIEGSYNKNSFTINAMWRDERIILEGNYDNTSAQLQLQSNYENLEASVSYLNDKANLRLVRNNKEINVELQKLPQELSFTVETPIQDYEMINFNARYDYTQNEKHLTVTFTQNQKTLLNGKVELKTPIIGEMKLTATLKHSTQQSECRMSLNAEYDLNSSRKTAFVEMNKNDKQIVSKIAAEFGQQETEIMVQIVTPFEEYKDISQKLVIGYGGSMKSIKLTTKINTEVYVYGAELTLGDGNISIRVYSPLLGYEDLMLTGEYELTPTSKFGRITYTVNGERREFSIGGKYDEDMVESNFYVSTPDFQRAITGRVRRSLDILYSDNYSSNQESRVIEIIGSLATTWESGKAHLQIKGWGYSELLVTYDLRNTEKTFEVELTNGDKTYRYTGQAEVSKNTIKGAIQIPQNDLSFSIDTELHNEEKYIRLNGRINDREFMTNLNFNFAPLKSYLTVVSDAFLNNFDATLYYDFTQNEKQTRAKLILENHVYEFKGNAVFGLNGNVELFFSIPEHELNTNVDYYFNEPAKSVKVTYSHNENRHFMEGTMALLRNEVKFNLRTSFANFENISGSAMYDFSNNYKKTKVSFEWMNQKYELLGNMESKQDSAEVYLTVETPITNYENIRLTSKLYTGTRPSVKIRFQIPSKTFEGTASYEFNQFYGESSIEITSDIEKLGNIRLHGTYDLRSVEKIANFIFTRNNEQHKGNLKVMYEGNLMKGSGYVKLDVPFLPNIDTEVTTNISPKLEDSEISIRFHRYTFNVYTNMKLTNGYIKYKSNLGRLNNFEVNWDMSYKNSEMFGKTSVLVNEVNHLDIDAYITYKGYNDVHATFDLFTPHINFKKLELTWFYSRLTKFQVKVKGQYRDQTYENNLEVKLGSSQGFLRLLNSGIYTEHYDFEADYIINNNRLNVNIRTPFTSPIEVEAYYSIKGDLYEYNIKGSMGSESVSFGINMKMYKELEIQGQLPFEGFQHLYGLFKIDAQPTKTDITVKLEKDVHTISLEQTITKKENKLHYFGYFVTPFTAFKETKLTMSLEASKSKYEGDFSFEVNSHKISSRFTLILNDYRKTSFFATLQTPFHEYSNLNLDASFTYNESAKTPEFFIQFEREAHVYNIRGHANTAYPDYSATLSIKTPLEVMKDISFDIKYSAQEKHNIYIKYEQNDNIRIETTGKVFASESEGDAVLDIKTSFPQVSDISFQSSYNFVSTQKRLSAYMNFLNGEPLVFDAKWNYGTQTYAAASLKSPWKQPNFDISIEGDLKSVNKNAMIKYESNGDRYELRFDRTVDQYGHSGSIVIHSPIYDNISFKFTITPSSVIATAEYGSQTIELNSEYTITDNTYSGNASLRTPFTYWENIQFKTYLNKQKGYEATGSLEWGYDKKIDAEFYMTDSKLTAKFDSPYPPYKNIIIDFNADRTNGYKLNGVVSWERSTIEINAYISSTKINIDLNTPFEPFKDMHLEGNLRKESDEFRVTGYGKWQGKKVKVTGSFLNYSDFGIRTALEVETSVPGYENYALYLDIKKPMSQQGIDASLELRSGKTTKTVTFLLTHNGLTDFDIVLTVLEVKSKLSFKLNRNPSIGETELKLSGSLPVEYFSKFSLYGNLAFPNKSNMKLNVELQTKSEVNKFFGNYQISDKEIKTEISADLPLLLLKPITLTFNLKNKSYKNFNLTGVMILPHKTYEVHGSFVMENNSLKMLFKENGLYNIEAEIDTAFANGVFFDAVLFLPNSKHNLNGSFKKSNNDLEIKGELNSPLLQHTVGFKLVTTYQDNQMDATISVTTQETHLMRASYVSNGYRYNGEILYEVSGSRQFSITTEYEPYSGSVTLTNPSGTHKVNFSLHKGNKKASFNLSANSHLLPGNHFEASFNFRNDGTAKKASINITTGTQTHSMSAFILLQEVEKKIETKIETPLFNLKEITFNSYLTKTNDQAEGEVLVNLPNETHSIRAILSKNFNAEFRINSPWLKSQQILITSKFENSNYKNVFGEISMKNGEEKFQLTAKYDITDPSFYQGYVILRSTFQGANFVELSGNLRTVDRVEYEIKFEGDTLPKFFLNGSYLFNKSIFTTALNIKSSIAEVNGIGFQVSVPLVKGERVKFVVQTSRTKYEFSGHVNFYQDKFTIDGITSWNNKEISGSLDVSFKNPIKIRVNIQTPFQGYERIAYNGKLFWELGENQVNRQYHVGIEYNEKVIEIRGVYTTNTVSAEIITPFEGYNRYEIEMKQTPGRSAQVALQYPGGKWGATVEYSADKLSNVWAKLDITTPYATNNFFSQISSVYKDGKYEGQYILNSGYYYIDTTVNAVLKPNEVSFNIQDISGHKIYVAGTLTRMTEISGEYMIYLPNNGFKNSGKFSATTRKSGNQLNYGVAVSTNEQELFHVNIQSEDKRVSIKVINPFYPVSLRYTYDNTPQTFEIEGEFCWDLNRRIETTIGSNLMLKKTESGAELSVKIAAPHHQVKLYTTYFLSAHKFDHQLSVIGLINDKEKTAGYGVTLERIASTSSDEYTGYLKVNIPEHEADVTSKLIVDASAIDGSVDFMYKEKSSLYVHFERRPEHMYQGKAVLTSPYLDLFEATIEGEVEYGNRYGVKFDIKHMNLIPISFKAVTSKNIHNTAMTYNTDIYFRLVPYNYDFSAIYGTEPDRYFGNINYSLNGHYEEYFFELYKNQKFRIGQKNVFLIEGDVIPTESGYKGNLTGKYGEEEYSTTVWAENNPALLDVDVRQQNKKLLNARFDATDILSTRIFLQPSLVFDVQDFVSDFI